MKRRPTTDLPADFGISERVRKWAAVKGYGNLDQHLEYFLLQVEKFGYRYSSWDAALMVAVRDDWARLGKGQAQVCAKCGGSLRAGHTKRKIGLVCNDCEAAA